MCVLGHTSQSSLTQLLCAQPLWSSWQVGLQECFPWECWQQPSCSLCLLFGSYQGPSTRLYTSSYLSDSSYPKSSSKQCHCWFPANSKHLSSWWFTSIFTCIIIIRCTSSLSWYNCSWVRSLNVPFSDSLFWRRLLCLISTLRKVRKSC